MHCHRNSVRGAAHDHTTSPGTSSLPMHSRDTFRTLHLPSTFHPSVAREPVVRHFLMPGAWQRESEAVRPVVAGHERADLLLFRVACDLPLCNPSISPIFLEALSALLYIMGLAKIQDKCRCTRLLVPYFAYSGSRTLQDEQCRNDGL